MQYLASVLLGLTVTVSANLAKRQYGGLGDDTDSEGAYLGQVCSPMNGTDSLDLNAPCGQTAAITTQCIYGALGVAILTGNESALAQYGDSDFPRLDNATQRACVCESQYFVAFNGCNDCFAKHGAAPITEDLRNGYIPQSIIGTLSSSYCAATNTPTLGFDLVLYALATGSLASSIASIASTASMTSTFSDPIGNQTAVSLYYTPSVTGSSAWVVAQATITPSNSTMTSGSASGSGSVSTSSMSLATNSDGQIVATAGATTSESGAASGTASGSSTASATAGSGAGKQETAAIAGFIALAGFVALL